jgi:SnoaL-like domain
MPSLKTLERFILRVEQNAHAEAVEEFYTPNASIQENQSAPRTGRDSQIRRERALLSKVQTLNSVCVRPIFVSGDRVVIRWQFRFQWLEGTVTEMEELAYQRWEGECIAEETFFYDPAQREPNPRTLECEQ